MFKNLLNQASNINVSRGTKAPKDKFSLENLKYLYSQLVKYPVVDSANANRIVEVLRAIAELMIWGDQHNPLFFDYFAEKNIITNFAKIIAQRHADVKVKTQVIQTLSILIQNTDSEQAVFYLLSNNYINDLIVTRFDFNDEELLAHYISFLKTLSFKLNVRTILFFYNDKANDFPLYVEALKFFNHSENMVRIAVRTLTLNIYKVEDDRMRRFIIDRSCLPFFSNLVWFLREQVLSMSRMIENPQQSNVARLEEFIENTIDFLFYLQDVISLNIDKMSNVLTDQLLSHFIFPVLVGSLVARYDPEKRKAAAAEAAAGKEKPKESHSKEKDEGPKLGLLSAAPQKDYTVQARLALYMLSQVFLSFNHYGLINSIAIALLHPNPPVICETIVRTPIKYPFRHPTTPLTGIIFPKSLVVAPVVQVVANADESKPAATMNSTLKVNGIESKAAAAIRKESAEKERALHNGAINIHMTTPSSPSPDLLFSHSHDNDDGNNDLFNGITPPRSPGTSPIPDVDNTGTLDFFSSSPSTANNASGNRSPSPSQTAPNSIMSPTTASPTPTTTAAPVEGEHAALMDMFAGIAPAPSSMSPASASSTSVTSPPPTASTSTSTTATATAAPTTVPPGLPPRSAVTSQPSSPISVPVLTSSSSASSLSSLRSSIKKNTSDKFAFLKSSTLKSIGSGVLDGPLGVCMNPVQDDGLIYVLDAGNYRIQVFDRAGKTVRKWGSKGSDDGQMMECEGICISPHDQYVYVTDHNNHRVSVYDQKGTFIKKWGSEGSGIGQFQHPTGIAISAGTGLIYVVDSWNHRIQIFDQQLNYVRTIGGKKGDKEGELAEPAHVSVCQSPLDQTQDRVYVTDYGNDRVQVFDQSGQFLLAFGHTGRERGEFISPIGITVHLDSVYIVDRGNHRVQVVDLQGGYRRSVGKKGSGTGELNEPNSVYIAPSDGRVTVADTSNNRIVLFSSHSSSSASSSAAASPSHSNETQTSAQSTLASALSPSSTAISTTTTAAAANGDAAAHSRVASASPAPGVPSAGASAVPPPLPTSAPAPLSTSYSTDDLSAAKEAPVDLNTIKTRSSLPEMRVVYNPEKSCPNYSSKAPTNRNKQAMMFALGSQDERVGFGALGVLYCMMKNEVMDKDVLLTCGLCPQSLRKQTKLLQELTKQQVKQATMDILFEGTITPTTATPGTPSTPATVPGAPNSSSSPVPTLISPPPPPSKASTLKKPSLDFDLMSLAASPPPQIPAAGSDNLQPTDRPAIKINTQSEDDGDDNDEEEEESSSEEDEEDADSPSDTAAPSISTSSNVNLSTTADADFFSGLTGTGTGSGSVNSKQSTTTTSSSNNTTTSTAIPSSASSANPSVTSTNASKTSASSTFDILASIPTTPRSRSEVKAVTVPEPANNTSTTNSIAAATLTSTRKASHDRVPSNDPLMEKKPTAAVPTTIPTTLSSAPTLPSHPPSQRQNSIDSNSSDQSAFIFEYNTEIVNKILTLVKPRQPPIRFTTLQLVSEMLNELVNNPTPNHPSLQDVHLQVIRDANKSIADELKLKFKIPVVGNYLLDVVEEDYNQLLLTVYPKTLITSTRNLLPIEEKVTGGVGLEWRTGANEYEKARRLCQFYLQFRLMRYTFTKKKDPFYPLFSTESSTMKVLDDLSLDAAAAVVPCVINHVQNKPMLLLIDTDVMVLMAKIEGKKSGKIESIISLRHQEPFASRINPLQVNVTIRSTSRPHAGARRIKQGPGVPVPNPDGSPSTPQQVSVSMMKPLWNIGVILTEQAAATSVRKTLEQSRIRLRKGMMNKIYKGFEQNREEETTSIQPATPPTTLPDGTVVPGTSGAPIVPFSILNLLGDRQAEIIEEDD